MPETTLEMLDRHVLLGERHIARQREIVAYFHRKGFKADIAEQLLNLFELMQIEHVAYRDRIAHVGLNIQPSPELNPS